MKALRIYQEAAIEASYKWMYERTDPPLVVIPPGGGKSLVIAALIQQALEEWPDTRFLIATHVKELIQQSYDELLEVWPWAPAGIFSAGLKRKDKSARILFAGVQSVWNKTHAIGYRDLLLIDEAHLVGPSETARYRQMLAALYELNPEMRVIGLTATPYRLGYGLLYGQEDSLFGGIAYEINIRDLIKQGYLSPLISTPPETQLDLSGVHVKGGEFVTAEVEEAVDQIDVTLPLVAEFVRAGTDRRSWLLFGATVGHCYHLRDAVRAHGIACEAVLGETPAEERARIIAAYRKHEIRCLVSRDVLTTGFNHPGVDLIGLARPTMSPGLFYQMVGRGDRLAEGKQDCLIQDYAGLISMHGPVDVIKPPKRPGKNGDAWVKTCSCCNEQCAGGCRVCPNCGEAFEFTDVEVRMMGKAGVLPILSVSTPIWIPCDDVFYAIHRKNGKLPSLRAIYSSGKDEFSEWQCFSHPKGSFPRGKAEWWWRRRALDKDRPPPASSEEAVQRSMADLQRPNAVRIRLNGKFKEVLGAKFPTPKAPKKETKGILSDDDIPF